jgi:hypothetical protein
MLLIFGFLYQALQQNLNAIKARIIQEDADQPNDAGEKCSQKEKPIWGSIHIGLVVLRSFFKLREALCMINVQINQMLNLIFYIGKAAAHFAAQDRNIVLVDEYAYQRNDTGEKCSQEERPVLVCVHV